MSNKLFIIIIIAKNYMFRPTVAIIRFYPKLYANKRVYATNVCLINYVYYYR